MARWIVQGSVKPPEQAGETITSDKWSTFSITAPILPKLTPYWRNARTITFSVITVPTIDLTPDASQPPAPRSSFYLRRDSIDQTHFVEAQVQGDVFPDSYHPGAERTVRPPSRPYYANARVITFTEMFPADWLQDFSNQVRRAVWPTKAEFIHQMPIAVEGEVTLDKWFHYRSPRLTPLPLSLGRYEIPLDFTNPMIEEVTSDKWTPNTNRLGWLAARPFFSNARIITFTEMFPADWMNGVTLPIRAVLGRFDRPALDIFTDVAPLPPAPELSWNFDVKPKYPLPRMVLMPSRGVAFAEFETEPEQIFMDKWNAPHRKAPPRVFKPYFANARTITFSIIPVPPAETITLDKWFDWSRPLPLAKRLARADLLYSYDFTNPPPEEVTLDKWLGSSSRLARPPIRLYFSQARTIGFQQLFPFDWNQQPHHFFQVRRGGAPEAIIIPFTAGELITSDKWSWPFQHRVPPKPLQRPDWTIDPRQVAAGEMITVDKWMGPFTQRVPGRPRNQGLLQSTIAPLSGTIVGTAGQFQQDILLGVVHDMMVSLMPHLGGS